MDDHVMRHAAGAGRSVSIFSSARRASPRVCLLLDAQKSMGGAPPNRRAYTRRRGAARGGSVAGFNATQRDGLSRPIDLDLALRSCTLSGSRTCCAAARTSSPRCSAAARPRRTPRRRRHRRAARRTRGSPRRAPPSRRPARRSPPTSPPRAARRRGWRASAKPRARSKERLVSGRIESFSCVVVPSYLRDA